MATLRGQNLRILDYDSTAQKYKVIAMATSCVITYTINTEQAQTKDDVGLSQKPTVVSRASQIRVDSLSVADVGSLLTAMRTSKQFTLMWDETSTSDNQTPVEGAFAMQTLAYLTDATFTFDNRTISSKNLQFTGIGPVDSAPSSISSQLVSSGSFTRGQYVRLFLESNIVIAAARTLSLHVSVSLEDATTKDTEGDWLIQEPTELSYDITTSALVRSNDVITSSVEGWGLDVLQVLAIQNDIPINWSIANVSGDNNRTKGAVIVSGQGVLTSLEINAAVKSAATYQMSLAGYGDYTVGA